MAQYWIDNRTWNKDLGYIIANLTIKHLGCYGYLSTLLHIKVW